VLYADYAGSEACRSCHSKEYADWSTSPMHRMTRLAGAADDRAPFDGEAYTMGPDRVTMETRGGERFMHLESARAGDRLFRITKIIGGRYREDFAGLDVTPGAAPAGELIMPVSWLLYARTWRYKGYSVMVPARPGLGAGPAWSVNCLPCHNTLPSLWMLYDDLFGPGAPAYQGSISDDLLPPTRSWPVVATDAAGLAAAVRGEVARLGAVVPATLPLPSVLTRAMHATRTRLDAAALVEVGVGCEACHGGARAHAEDPLVRPVFGVRSPLVRVGPAPPAAASRAERINRACARCHTVLFSHYPYTWEGALRGGAAPGGSSINSGEARDFLLGGCAAAMSCADCHDPHGEDARAKLAALGTLAGNALCVRCHSALASAAAVAAHTHHRPDGPGAVCLDCHMPRKNMGLDARLTRYHRIGSPTDDARVLGDRPLECAACHPTSSVEALAGAMERWWGRRYDRAILRDLYGDDLSAGVLAATLARGKPHEVAAAIGLLAAGRVTSALPAILPALWNDYPLVRYFAKRAIEEMTGTPLPLDVEAPADAIRAAVTALRLSPPRPAPR
jgi:predicted CXXCH cytochrome family protein